MHSPPYLMERIKMSNNSRIINSIPRSISIEIIDYVDHQSAPTSEGGVGGGGALRGNRP